MPQQSEMDRLDERAILSEAIARAAKLVRSIEQQQADLLASPPALPAEKMEAGRVAMAQAVAAARRSLDSLLQAALAAGYELDDNARPGAAGSGNDRSHDGGSAGS